MGELMGALREAMAIAKDDPSRALDVLERALVTARGELDAREISRVVRHAAVMCERLGDLDRALRYYGEAIAGDPDEALLYLAIGGIHVDRREPKGARKSYERCLELGEKTGDQELVAMVSSAIGRLDGS